MRRPDLMTLLAERVLIFDGATGSNLQGYDLTPDDFAGAEGCNEVLVRTRPDVVQGLHESFLRAGCHVVETNSFGGTRVVLDEFELGHEARALNRRAAELALEVARDHSTADRPRYVAGSMGPGTKLPSLEHIGFDELVAAYQEQAAGLIEGGVDLLAVETCQDVLQTRAALRAVRLELGRAERRVPVLVSLTLEVVGTMLLGTELPAALAALLPLRPDILGLNCATGPLEMKRHVQLLSRSCPLPLSVMPNAGLPDNVDGRPVYPLSPEEFARWHASFVSEDGVQVVGGCCGTSPEHVAALVREVEQLQPAARSPRWEPAVSSLYSAVPLDQQPKPLLVGERTNANGSRKFRKLLLADNWDGMVQLARGQERGGAHTLDLCVAYVGRDEQRDINEVTSRYTRQVRLPLVIDSTQPEVMEAALKRCGGRCVLNSINLEDGEDRARQVLTLARDFGAAVVALTIDEQGMARSLERKLEVAERIYRLATEAFGLAPHDLIFDVLTFTICSGDKELRDAAVQTLEAIEQVKTRLPGVWTILGVSNISFGLKPRSRHVLNSVFLQQAVQRGLDLAIVEARKITPLNRIDPEARTLAEDLLADRREQGDPLQAYMQHFAAAGKGPAGAVAAQDSGTLSERLHRRVVDGDRTDLELLLAAALTVQQPLQIINGVLIPAMKEVGELFGSGQMQLPFVLQSAEVMKHAVSLLEPVMERSGVKTEPRGTLVLATVKGDVHDIGKNLVDILLSNNGYRVVNLGIKIGVEQMIESWQQEQADAIGMSGLLVKSTMVMRENLEELRRRGLQPHVLLGGAALTRRYVERDLRQVYGSRVSYGKDAFEGMDLMQQVVEGSAPAPDAAPLPDSKPANLQAALGDHLELARACTAAPEGIEPCDVPQAPFLGSRVADLPLPQVLDLLNETTLFRGQWQYRRGKLPAEKFAEVIEQQARPALERLRRQVIDEQLLQPRAVYGYFPCAAASNELTVLDPETGQQRARFHFPRQLKPPHLCVADFFSNGDQDLFGCFVVTVGQQAAARVAQLFEEHRYRDYLHLHGLAVEAAEAAAEYVHRLMRQQLGIHQQDAPQAEGLFRQQYRGSRYSFGYPSSPDLEDQRALFELLQPERIDVSLTEQCQMVPEQSVSAFVVHHPAAKYFTV